MISSSLSGNEPIKVRQLIIGRDMMCIQHLFCAVFLKFLRTNL